GAATLVNLLALLTAAGTNLSELVAELPQVHIVHHSVHTPWDQKGMVMRTLVESSQGRDLVLDDGAHRLGPGDGVVIKGVDHRWETHEEGCRMSVVVIATPPLE
ncbi:MAG: hypothetical protein ACHQNA_03205, partial [Acidimicrobiales bacterium]